MAVRRDLVDLVLARVVSGEQDCRVVEHPGGDVACGGAAGDAVPATGHLASALAASWFQGRCALAVVFEGC